LPDDGRSGALETTSTKSRRGTGVRLAAAEAVGIEGDSAGSRLASQQARISFPLSGCR